jgi:outer membrane receptor protein involved in Fe transport
MEGDFISPFGPSASYTRRWSARAQSDLAISRAFDLSAGIEYQRERAGSTFITAGPVEVPVTRSIVGYFAEARARAGDRFFATAGLRLEDIHRDALQGDPNPFSPRPAFAEDSILSLNPRVSAAWFARTAAASFTKLRGGAGTGIRPPGGFDIAFTDNPSLQPERSVSAELGVDQAFAGGHGLIEATAFFNSYDDLIVAVGSFRESSRYRTDNISNARARGFEAAGSGRMRLNASVPIDLHARVAYTFLDSEVLAVDGSDGAEPPFTVGDPLLRRPRHQLSVDLSVDAGRLRTFVRGGARARVLDVEPSLGTFGGLFYAEGYNAWNAGASWRIRRGVEIFARVDNLFDRAYEESLGFPAPGRGAYAGLRLAAGR